MTPDDPRHGTVAGYNAHRKSKVESCPDCRRAMAAYGARLELDHIHGRPRMVDATGSARRVQALVAIGYTFGELGTALGVSHDVARHYAISRARVRVATAEKITDLYERLSMRRATGPRARYARTTAARRGWAPPLAWDDDMDDPAATPNLGGTDDQLDEVVIERLVAGHHVPSTRAEKCEALRRWLDSGRSQASLCGIHGWQQGRYIEREEAA